MDNTYLVNSELKFGKHKHDLEFPKSNDFFSLTSSLIPGIGGVNAVRVLLGSKSAAQAITLTNREAPLVQANAGGDSESAVKKYGKWLCIHAADDGEVASITPDELICKEKGKTKVYELYNNYNVGRKTYMSNYPKVAIGQRYKKGDLLATSNYTDDKGQLALGINLTTAIGTGRKGAGFEDAIILSTSGSRKLQSEQQIRLSVEKKFGVDVNKGRYISLFPNRFFNKQLDKIDSDGVIKVGSKVEHGDPLVLAFTPKAVKATDLALGKLSSLLKNAYTDHVVIWDHEAPGEIVDAVKAGELISVNVRFNNAMMEGDKLSNPFGAKGTVRIIPDAQMVQLPDGTVPDVLLNSMSITSRVAPALVLSMGLGKVAQKTGKPQMFPQFSKTPNLAEVEKTLEKHGVSELEEVYDPISNTHLKMTVGPLYFTRLVHNAEDKVSYKSQGSGYTLDATPGKTNEEATKRIGNLGTTALLSHGSEEVLKDFTLIKSQKNDDFWRAMKLGQPLPVPKVPQIFEKFIASLQGAGIKVTQRNNKFQLLPMTNQDIGKISKHAIDNPLTYKVKEDQLIPEPGGLFDPEKTGVFGKEYNHIDLNFAIPNPISEDYLRKVFKVTKSQYEKMVTSGEIKQKLEALDLTKEITKYKEYLKSGRRTDRDDAVKILGFLQTLKKNNITPKDLLLNKLPVIPAIFRPVVAQGDMTLSADVNYLYKDMMLNNNALKDTANVPEHVVEELKKKQYEGAKAIYGLGDPISVKNQEKGFKGLLAKVIGLKGVSPKTSMFQTSVVNHSLDLVGRGVATTDATLHMDEAGMPQNLIWSLYKPFIMRRLVQRGIPATKATEYIDSRNPLAVEALHEELKIRPGIISRDPALHKFNLMGFYLKPHADPKNSTIALNPLVFKGFSLDTDGDQVNTNIPVLESARQEVIDKMLPSKCIVHHKTMSFAQTPQNEGALGLYTLSKPSKKTKVHKFANEAEVIKAYNSGLLQPDDQVELANK
jgi:hypothetical protein